jgi:alkylated DNA repair protein alkB family protein 1
MSNASAAPLKPSHADLTPYTQKNHNHDTHAHAPWAIWETYKKYQRMNDSDIDNDVDIVDFKRGLSDVQKAKIVPVATVPSETIAAAGMTFKYSGQKVDSDPEELLDAPNPCTVYEHKEFNGKPIHM